MAYTIVTNTCEGIADCAPACPVACIHPGEGKNPKGTDWYWIDFDTCIDCGICLQICPVAGAILPEERPDLQNLPSWTVIAHLEDFVGFDSAQPAKSPETLIDPFALHKSYWIFVNICNNS